MSIELKIKAKHLAVESRIIKREEFKIKRAANPKKYAARFLDKPHEDWSEEDRAEYKRRKQEAIARARATLWTERRKSAYESLRSHRITVVRDAARWTHLARMFIKGTPYLAAEQRYKTLDRGTSHAREAKNIPNVAEIARMVKQYGGDRLPEQVRNLGSDEKIAAVLEIVKEWTGKF